MFNDLLRERFDNLLSVRISERRRVFPYELMRINAEATKMGAFQSSGRLLRINRAYDRELEVRTILAWQSLVRVHKTLGCPLSHTLRDDLKVEIGRVIDTAFHELSGDLQEAHRNSGINLDSTFERARSEVVQKHDIEIDLYVDSLSQASKSLERYSMNNQYNFYGNVGAVQSGASAVANVVQNLGASDRSELMMALSEVRDAIAQDTSLTKQQRSDLEEIAQECLTQIHSDSPNNAKLLSMFSVLGTAVQTMASAAPAYHALKAALLPLGITLP